MSRSDIAHLHMRIVKIERVGQSAHILSIHVEERDKETQRASCHFRKRQELGLKKFGNKRTKNGPGLGRVFGTLFSRFLVT